MSDSIKKSDDQWREELSPEQYHVCRLGGTEAAFTGEYHAHKDPGKYLCVCCGERLFASEAKFDSGTGWPSFYEPATGEAVNSQTDESHGMVRDEVICTKCGAHLGHVFPDGPNPTGQRYCINSASLKFEPKKAE